MQALANDQPRLDRAAAGEREDATGQPTRVRFIRPGCATRAQAGQPRPCLARQHQRSEQCADRGSRHSVAAREPTGTADYITLRSTYCMYYIYIRAYIRVCIIIHYIRVCIIVYITLCLSCGSVVRFVASYHHYYYITSGSPLRAYSSEFFVFLLIDIRTLLSYVHCITSHYRTFRT